MYEIIQIWKKIRLHLLLLTLALALGIVGYHLIYPDHSFTHLLYMTVITLSTVGYTDLFGMENNPAALGFSMILILVGLSVVLYSASTITAYFIEGKIDKLFLLRKTFRRINKMENHFIICGAGQTGIHVIREMHTLGIPFVVIDNHDELIEHVRTEFKDALAIKGDATNDEILQKSNIDHAQGLVVALSNDKDNLFLTLTARIKNPKLKIVSRSIDLGMREKLITAGADYVVSPNYIGGMRMASEILRPNVVSFLDVMLRGADKTIRIHEFIIPENSPQVGKTLSEVNLYTNCHVNLLASKTSSTKSFQYNPGPDMILEKNHILLFIGTNKNTEAMKKLFS